MAENNNDVVISDDDAFAEAFGQAIAAEGAEDSAAENNPKEAASDEPASTPKDGEGEAAGATEGEGGKVEGTSPPASTPESGDVDDNQPPATTAKADNAELIEAIKSLVPKQEPKEATPPPQPEADLPEPQLYEYTDEERAVIENYNKEWDEHAKAIALREKKLVHDLEQRLTHQYTKALGVVLQQLEQSLAPVLQTHVESAQERHFSTIRSRHSDFETLKPEVEAWIAQQPKYLQPHLKQTYDSGSADAVVELYDDFKKATGRTQPGTTTPAGSGAAKKDAVPAHKAADLAPVTSKRTVIQPSNSGPDQNDFDGGFAEALKASGF